MSDDETTADDGFARALALAMDRHRAGDVAGADRVFRQALSIRPTHPGARQASGLTAVQVRDYPRAAGLLEPFANQPAAPPQILQGMATALFGLRRYTAAADMLRRALTGLPGDGPARLMLAQCLQAMGSIEEAVAQLKALLVARPADLEALLTFGALVARQERVADRQVLDWWCVLSPLEEAAWSLLARFPKRPVQGPRHLLRSLVLQARDASAAQAQIHVASSIQHDADLAALYRRLVIRFPRDAEVWHNASRYYDGVAELDRSIRAAMRASVLRPGQLHYDLQVARGCRRAKRLADAKAIFERITGVAAQTRSPSGRTGAQARLQLARIAEEEAAFEAAFDYAVSGNRLARLQEPAAATWVTERMASVRSAQETVPGLGDRLRSDRSEDRGRPVFLIGFPRSGTTLLEQVLDGHPDIATIEEQPTLTPVLRAIGERYGSVDAFVARATDHEAAELARAYLASRAGFLPPGEAAVVVDKMPLSTVLVPLILRLFPGARFLFALRHPCDVCLSCFFSDFVLNANMAPFTDFRDTAAFYDGVMRLWQRCDAELPLDYHTVRYECVVTDLEAEARAAIGFLELPWIAEVVDFHRTVRAKARQGRIRTPSYAQVAEPLYSRAAGRWRNYRDRFEVVKPLLLPHVDAYGYRWDDDPS